MFNTGTFNIRIQLAYIAVLSNDAYMLPMGMGYRL